MTLSREAAKEIDNLLAKTEVGADLRAKATFADFILVLLAGVVGLPMWGWATALTWNWFAPVIVTGAPVMTVVQGIAARLIVNVLLARSKKSEPVVFKKMFGEAVIIPLVIIGINWIAHLFIHV